MHVKHRVHIGRKGEKSNHDIASAASLWSTKYEGLVSHYLLDLGQI